MAIPSKYAHLAAVTLIAGAMFLSLLIVPLVIIDTPLSFNQLLSVYTKYFVLGGTLFLTAVSMAWLFCELNSFKISRVAAAILFGLICPILFLTVLGLILWVIQGIFLKGITDPQGMKNVIFIYLIFAPLTSYIYWYASKDA